MVIRVLSNYPFLPVSIALATLLFGVRFEWGLEVRATLAFLVLSLFLQVLPIRLMRLQLDFGAALFLTLGLVMGLGFLIPLWAPLILLALFGITFLLPQPAPAGEMKFNSQYMFLFVIASIWTFFTIAAVTWQSGYLSLFFDEKILLGLGNTDTLGLADYGKMIQSYGRVGAGIHGFTELKYHVGSQLFLVAISNITQEPLEVCYNWGAPILLAPLLLSTLYWTARSFENLDLGQCLAVFVGVVTLSTQIFSQKFLDKWGLWHSYFISESYTFGLTLMFAYLQMLWSLHIRERSSPWLTYVLMPIALALVVASKVSVGFICALLYAAFFINRFVKSPKQAPYLSGLVSAASALSVLYLTKMPMTLDWSWHFFVNKYSGSWLKFYLFHYYHLWVLIGLTWWGLRKNWLRLSEPLSALILASLMAFVATWPSLHFTIIGGSGYYFTNIPMWLSILGIVLFLTKLAFRLRVGFLWAAIVLSSVNVYAFATRTVQLWSDGRQIESQVRAPNEQLARYQKYVHALRKLRVVPGHFFVYISAQEIGYWGAFSEERRCMFPVHLPFNQSGRPAIFGVPSREERNCLGLFAVELWVGKGYRDLPEPKDDRDLCEEASKFRTSLIYKLQWNELTRDVDTVQLNCGGM